MLTKAAYFDFLNRLFENSSLEEMANAMDTRLPYWTEEFKKRKFAGYMYCPNCGRFSRTEGSDGFKHIKEPNGTYVVCPRCLQKTALDK